MDFITDWGLHSEEAGAQLLRGCLQPRPYTKEQRELREVLTDRRSRVEGRPHPLTQNGDVSEELAKTSKCYAVRKFPIRSPRVPVT